MTVAEGLALLTSEYTGQPLLTAWLSALVDPVADVTAVLEGLPEDFSIATGTGAQLDVLGQVVGASREVNFNVTSTSSRLGDEHFRTVIQAQVAKNQWDGTLPSIYTLWQSIFGPHVQLQIIDSQNMSVQAIITGLNDAIYAQLISQGYIIPKPMGVQLTIIEQTLITSGPYFGALVSGIDQLTLTTETPT